METQSNSHPDKLISPTQNEPTPYNRQEELKSVMLGAGKWTIVISEAGETKAVRIELDQPQSLLDLEKKIKKESDNPNIYIVEHFPGHNDVSGFIEARKKMVETFKRRSATAVDHLFKLLGIEGNSKSPR